MDFITTITAYFQAGQTYTLHVPVTMENLHGYFPQKTGSVSASDGTPREFKMGFWLEDKEAGEIVKTYSDKVAIDYKHKYSADQTIWFYAVTGERVRILVSSVQIHDHSSVVMGGPAYGTYYSDPGE